MNLALFDFDGTITKKDSFLDFLKYSFPAGQVWRSTFALLHWLAGYKIGLVSVNRAKEKVLIRFFKGLPAEQLEQMGEKYALEALPRIIRKSSLAKIEEHIQNGDQVVIVTASVTQYVKPFASKLGVSLLSTEMEVRNGILTGKLEGKNCRGAEKARRIKAAYNLSEYASIYAYGDTKGDREMLSLANFPFMKHFGH